MMIWEIQELGTIGVIALYLRNKTPYNEINAWKRHRMLLIATPACVRDQAVPVNSQRVLQKILQRYLTSTTGNICCRKTKMVVYRKLSPSTSEGQLKGYINSYHIDLKINVQESKQKMNKQQVSRYL